MTASSPAPAQAIAAANSPETTRDSGSSSFGRSASDASIFNRPDARTITLSIPAPRGQIVDREGEPLVNNRVAYHLAINYGQFEVADRDFIVRWARQRLKEAAEHAEGIVEFTDDELWEHYRHRRWLPLIVSGYLDDEEVKKLSDKTGVGLVLHPVYARNYPEGGFASHILGYAGSVGKLPTGPINQNEPLFEEIEGRAGLEKLFDEALTGLPGKKRLLFDSDGSKLLEEQTRRPKPGGTVVTTLNLRWQKLAEEVLKEGCERGAFVVLDVVTGEVLVMASRPNFDLNRFVPGISSKEFKELQEDPGQPLFGRAFQSAYPPASSFKPIVALAALDAGAVGKHTLIHAPAAMTIGNHTFHNWTKVPEGDINVKRALARSTNTWFYQVGIRVGPEAFLGLARRLGYGSTTGLPLIGETSGLVPTNQWMIKHEGRRILHGDTANLSIGQGVLLASPLQVAQGMAGIAHGDALPKLQLIRQVQNMNGGVVMSSTPERKNWLSVDNHAVQAVREGMRDTVNGSGGTGRSAALSFTELCGKTGTAQWGPPSKNQRLAWFAGFLPYENPRYAFAVLYEGKPNQTVSGGRMAAPMVKKFFEELKDEITENIAPPQRAVVVIDEADEDRILRAIPVDPMEIEQDFVPFEGESNGEELPEGEEPFTGEGEALPPRPNVPPPSEIVSPGGAVFRALPVEEVDLPPAPEEGVIEARPAIPVDEIPPEEIPRALPVEEP